MVCAVLNVHSVWLSPCYSFRNFDFKVDKDTLKGVFDKIDRQNDDDEQDGQINIKEYKLWKERVGRDLEEQKVSASQQKDECLVYFRSTDDGIGHYEILKSDLAQRKGCKADMPIATLNRAEEEEKVQWALFIPKLTKRQRKPFLGFEKAKRPTRSLLVSE